VTISKEEKGLHKLALKKLIRKNRGTNPSNLIKKLNNLIQIWSKSKKSYLPASICLELERFISLHLWRWSERRHPTLSIKAIKSKYWQKVKNGRLLFVAKDSISGVVKLRVLSYSEVIRKREKMGHPKNQFLFSDLRSLLFYFVK
jgi:hypothetical protein